MEDRGVVPSIPDLYFGGVPYQYSLASSLIGGVGRDAAYVAGRVASLAADRGTPGVIRTATACIDDRSTSDRGTS